MSWHTVLARHRLRSGEQVLWPGLTQLLLLEYLCLGDL